MLSKQGHKTIEEWQAKLGENIHNMRMLKNLDQKELALQSGASLTAVRRLEKGKTTTTETLICVLRALGKTDWLTSLAPAIDINPLQMAKRATKAPRQRVRKTTKETN
ncbi:MAG: helix-turn-helix transcriptional regulator [Deltaproteobacteria bacterium]